MDVYKLENSRTGRVVCVNYEEEIFNYLRRWGCRCTRDLIAWAVHIAWFGESRTVEHITMTIIDNRFR